MRLPISTEKGSGTGTVAYGSPINLGNINPQAINNQGWIVGIGTLNLVPTAFLIKPK